MADKKTDKKDAEEADKGKAKKTSSGISKKTLIFSVVGVVLLLSIGVGSAFFMMSSMLDDSSELSMSEDENKNENDTKKESDKSDEEDVEREKIIYVAIKPEFIVNFHGKDRQHFLQLNVSLSTRKSSVVSTVKTHLPLIRNAMIMLFGGQSFESLKTLEGKTLLRQQAREAIQAILKQEMGEKGIDEVFFTSFVMQ